MAVCAAFGLTASEAMTEMMCLCTKGFPEATVIFSVKAAGQAHNKTNKFIYLGGGGGGHQHIRKLLHDHELALLSSSDVKGKSPPPPPTANGRATMKVY